MKPIILSGSVISVGHWPISSITSHLRITTPGTERAIGRLPGRVVGLGRLSGQLLQGSAACIRYPAANVLVIERNA